MPSDNATDERRDTYDSRRIDGLVSSVARLEVKVDTLTETAQKSADAAHSLRNSIFGGCAVALILAVVELAARGAHI